MLAQRHSDTAELTPRSPVEELVLPLDECEEPVCTAEAVGTEVIAHRGHELIEHRVMACHSEDVSGEAEHGCRSAVTDRVRSVTDRDDTGGASEYTLLSQPMLSPKCSASVTTFPGE